MRVRVHVRVCVCVCGISVYSNRRFGICISIPSQAALFPREDRAESLELDPR